MNEVFYCSDIIDDVSYPCTILLGNRIPYSFNSLILLSFFFSFFLNTDTNYTLRNVVVNVMFWMVKSPSY